MKYQRIADDVVLGKGVVIRDFVNLYGCSIGDNSRVGTFVEIQNGVAIGRNCKISSHTFICEGVTIEDDVFVGHNVSFINDRRPRATVDGRLQTAGDWVLERTLVKRGASIGTSATILCGVVIGENALVGAGSVVTRDVPPGAVVVGNPARVIGRRGAAVAAAREPEYQEGGQAPMHVLVTGVAGFIAAKVAELLLAAGHTVTGVDNLNEAYDVRLKHWRLDRLKGHPAFTFRLGDVADAGDVRALFEGAIASGKGAPAAVVNLAARAGVRQSVIEPRPYYDTNVTGTLNLLEACREFGVPKFVLASTSSLYGLSEAIPYREDVPTDKPLSPYAASKKAAETLCYAYHHLHGIDVSVLRYFTVYGPAGRPDMSPFRFVQWLSEGRPLTIYGDGTQRRDFTYVDDVARGTLAALRPLGYEVINLGSDEPVVLNDAIHLLEEMIGRRATVVYEPRHAADVPATWADIGKAERLLGWRPQVSFADGIGRLVEWYQANRDWAREIRTDEGGAGPLRQRPRAGGG